MLPAVPCRAACALKCMGGHIQGRLWPRDDKERAAALERGYDLNKILTLVSMRRYMFVTCTLLAVRFARVCGTPRRRHVEGYLRPPWWLTSCAQHRAVRAVAATFVAVTTAVL